MTLAGIIGGLIPIVLVIGLAIYLGRPSGSRISDIENIPGFLECFERYTENNISVIYKCILFSAPGYYLYRKDGVFKKGRLWHLHNDDEIKRALDWDWTPYNMNWFGPSPAVCYDTVEKVESLIRNLRSMKE